MPIVQPRKVAIIDIDGVLCCTCPTAMNKLRKAEGLLPVPPPTEYGLSDYFSTEREYCLKAFKEPKVYELCEPFEGAVDAVKEIATKFDICYFTARGVDYNQTIDDNSIGDVTLRWLRQQGFPEAPTCFLGPGETKVQVAKSHYGNDIAFIVEDKFATANDFAEAGIEAFLVRYPYNWQAQYPSKVIPVGSIKDVPFWAKLLGMEK